MVVRGLRRLPCLTPLQDLLPEQTSVLLRHPEHVGVHIIQPDLVVDVAPERLHEGVVNDAELGLEALPEAGIALLDGQISIVHVRQAYGIGPMPGVDVTLIALRVWILRSVDALDEVAEGRVEGGRGHEADALQRVVVFGAVIGMVGDVGAFDALGMGSDAPRRRARWRTMST